MAFIREAPDARNFDIGPDAISFETKWIVWSAINEVDVEAAVLLGTPAVYRRLVRQRMKAEEQVTGSGLWFVTVPYGTIDPLSGPGTTPFMPPPPDANGPLNGPNGPKFSFDTTGETKHITQSLETRSASTTSQSGTADRDNNQAIGVSNDKVEGCDVIAPKFDFTFEMPMPFVTMAYIMALHLITGTVNYGQRVLGFEKGELLFRGATGSYTVDDKWNITHHFSAKQNQTDLQITGALFPTPGANAQPDGTGVIKVPLVCGWDYLWCEYVTATVGTDFKRKMQVPRKAYVEIVYPTGDFSVLPGGPDALKKKLIAGGVNPNDPGFFASMSERMKPVVRAIRPSALPGTLVEWSWSDPRLPDDIIPRP